MRVRILALAGMLSLSAQPAAAQEVASKTDPSVIHACPGNPPADFAGTVWHSDHVGVSRLIPEMPGSDSLQVFRFFTGPTEGDLLTAKQRRSLQLAKDGIQHSLAYLFFTEAETPIDKRPQWPPADFYDKLVDAAQPKNLHEEVLPCGTILPAGLTYGTRLVREQGKEKVVVSALPGPTMIWWYQDGAETTDGRPGVKASITKPVAPADGPYKDVPVEVVVFDICGNVSGRVAIAETTEAIAPAAPVVVPSPAVQEQPHITIPPNLPPPEQALPIPVEVVHHHHHFCSGNWKYVCIAAPIAAAGLFFIPSSSPSGPKQPNKTGGPGGRPQ